MRGNWKNMGVRWCYCGAVKDEVSRHQTQAALADRNVGFTKVLLVSGILNRSSPLTLGVRLATRLKKT
jgi:hypothetical protein